MRNCGIVLGRAENKYSRESVLSQARGMRRNLAGHIKERGYRVLSTPIRVWSEPGISGIHGPRLLMKVYGHDDSVCSRLCEVRL